MNRRTSLIGCVVFLLASPWAVAQVANEGLANQIILARQKNSTLLKQYNWNSRMELLENGNVKDLRIELNSYGADGTLQRSLLNDQESSMPRGFLRHAVAENKKKETEKYMKGLRDVLEQYTLPSGGAVINFISQAKIQPAQSPDGKPILQMTGNNVVNPGDTYSLTVAAGTFQTRRVEISTFYDGDPVTVTATFKTMPTGLTHLQYSTVEVPSKNLVLQVHNFDYAAND